MKRGTIYDIAAKLNLSPATVGRALKGKETVSAGTATIHYHRIGMGEIITTALIDEIERNPQTKPDHTIQIKSRLMVRASSLRNCDTGN